MLAAPQHKKNTPTIQHPVDSSCLVAYDRNRSTAAVCVLVVTEIRMSLNSKQLASHMAIVAGLVSSVLVLVLASGVVCKSAQGGSSPATVISLTDQSFEHDTQASTGATTGDWLVLFYSPHCGHCHAVLTVWESVARTLHGEVNVAQVDVSVNPTCSSRFSQSVPTMALFKHGKMCKYLPTKGRTHDAFVDFARRGDELVECIPVPSELGVFGSIVEHWEAFSKDIYDVYESHTEAVLAIFLGGGVVGAVLVACVHGLTLLCFGGQALTSQPYSAKRRIYKKVD
eukprot:GHVQ01004568.1.p1 GENE.GHVQ01004568.1~~GHVQ01004568.1.p1  ORF type:complete len:284 (-),score=29.95 GHVQ01004568.1:734-1585(-)